MSSENYLPVVVGVAVVGDHVLRILFSDGTVGDVDFSAEQWTGVLEPLNDASYLAQAGQRVGVLERAERVGGILRSTEPSPGFTAPGRVQTGGRLRASVTV